MFIIRRGGLCASNCMSFLTRLWLSLVIVAFQCQAFLASSFVRVSLRSPLMGTDSDPNRCRVLGVLPVILPSVLPSSLPFRTSKEMDFHPSFLFILLRRSSRSIWLKHYYFPKVTDLFFSFPIKPPVAYNVATDWSIIISAALFSTFVMQNSLQY